MRLVCERLVPARAAGRVVPALLLLVSCGSGPSGQEGEQPVASTLLPVPSVAQTARVVRQVDGDTVVLRGDGPGPLPGGPTRVRLLQVDTPEVHGEQECFGPEASERTQELLPVGASVRVQADERLRDRYGRTLLLLWDAQGRSVQEVLVHEGYARVLHVAPNDLALQELTEIEQAARQADRGLWGAC